MRALERAARALWFERGGSWSDASDRQKQQCIYETRAVLMAVRDNPNLPGVISVSSGRITANECMAELIDAILGEGEGE